MAPVMSPIISIHGVAGKLTGLVEGASIGMERRASKVRRRLRFGLSQLIGQKAVR